MQTPAEITPEIRDLCLELDPEGEPVYVQVKPEPWSKLGDCFGNVEHAIRQAGGRLQYGWDLSIWPNLLLEAQFHAIHVTANSEYIDVSPSQYQADRILFHPDGSRRFDGTAIPNPRIPLKNNYYVLEYIRLTDEKDRIDARNPTWGNR